MSHETATTSKSHDLVIGFDFSELSERALQEALELAARRPPTVLHVVVVGLPAGKMFLLPDRSEPVPEATARERVRLEGKIDAITSQGRLQGWMVSAMPLLLGLVLNFIRPDLIQPMLHHLFGYVLVALILIMEALGYLLIRRIVNVDV